MRVIATETVGQRKLGLGFECDVNDVSGFDRRSKALRWSMARAVDEQRDIMRGAIVGAPADPEAFG